MVSQSGRTALPAFIPRLIRAFEPSLRRSAAWPAVLKKMNHAGRAPLTRIGALLTGSASRSPSRSLTLDSALAFYSLLKDL